MSVTFVEPDFSKYSKPRTVSPGNDPVDPLDDADECALSDSGSRPENERAEGSNTGGIAIPRRKSSGSFQRRVSFDTISSPESGKSRGPLSPSNSIFPNFMSSHGQTNKDRDREYSSYFVSSRHSEHRYSSDSRAILFSYSPKQHSDVALRWIISNILQDGDELICLRMLGAADATHLQHHYQPEAQRLLNQAEQIAAEYGIKVNIVVELGVGKVKTVVYKTLVMYQPCLIVVAISSKSPNSFRRMRYKSSINSYLLSRGPLPVVIVTPNMTATGNPVSLVTSDTSEPTPPGVSPADGTDSPKGGNSYFASLQADIDSTNSQRPGSVFSIYPTSDDEDDYDDLAADDDDYDIDDDFDDDDSDDDDANPYADDEDGLEKSDKPDMPRHNSVGSSSSSQDEGSLIRRWKSFLKRKKSV
uniref:ARAD1D28380p n=1 Tax=Blastobotrys adeninivorans TaxID=409370 RepID=A0A060TBK3_BLAAD